MREILKKICRLIYKPKIINSMYISSESFVKKYIIGFVNTYCKRTGIIRFDKIKYDVVISAFKIMINNEIHISLFINIEYNAKSICRDLDYDLNKRGDKESIKRISHSLYKFIITNPNFDKIMSDEEKNDIIREISIYVEEHLIPDLIKEGEDMGQ